MPRKRSSNRPSRPACITSHPNGHCARALSRAVLAEEALERNMVELGFPAQQLHQLTEAVNDAQRRAELAKDGPLNSCTFVRRHRRNR
jgi:hypothetical protein